MTAITKCPECGTRFKVTDAQLDAHEGLVRCGRCHEVFYARNNLHDNEPSPQLSLPIEPELPLAESANQTSATDLQPADSTSQAIAAVAEQADYTVSGEAVEQTAESPQAELEVEDQVAEQQPTALAQQVQFIEELTDEITEPAPRKRRWLAMLIAALLGLALLAQAAYFFRVELAARVPQLKPLLEQYCSLLNCTVALPRQADLLSIDSTELESDPEQSNLVTLHALLHNHAPYAQAYPSLELTLTDQLDQPVARRVFHPADYLKAGDKAAQGAPADRDIDISMRLDTTDLKASGYRLLLLYPQQ